MSLYYGICNMLAKNLYTNGYILYYVNYVYEILSGAMAIVQDKFNFWEVLGEEN